MDRLETLLDAIRREALREAFPVDLEVYQRNGKDASSPILYAGSLDAPVCVLGRDLGKDEVAAGQPLIGAGGRLVRAGIYRAWRNEEPPKADRQLLSVLPRVLLTNTVPFKPPGNKAYSRAVKERFRPFLERFLVEHWRGGQHVITLGNEAFAWFAPYFADPDEPKAFWNRPDRYEASIACRVTAETSEGTVQKRLELMPLPHPSPLNQRWYGQFPGLLDRRLASIADGSG